MPTTRRRRGFGSRQRPADEPIRQMNWSLMALLLYGPEEYTEHAAEMPVPDIDTMRATFHFHFAGYFASKSANRLESYWAFKTFGPPEGDA